MKELEKVLKKLSGFVAPWWEYECQPSRLLELLWTGPPTKELVEGPMTPTGYVAEDGLVGHQWEE